MGSVSKDRPRTLTEFEKRFPQAWKGFQSFRDACDKEGPLNEKTRELIKVALETAGLRRGGLIAHIHRAKGAGASSEEIYQAILLAGPLVGIPAVLDAFLIAQRHLK